GIFRVSWLDKTFHVDALRFIPQCVGALLDEPARLSAHEAALVPMQPRRLQLFLDETAIDVTAGAAPNLQREVAVAGSLAEEILRVSEEAPHLLALAAAGAGQIFDRVVVVDARAAVEADHLDLMPRNVVCRRIRTETKHRDEHLKLARRPVGAG